MEPRYIHDCDACVFLGQYKEYDLYYCPSEPTVICRESSEPGDYGSGLVFSTTQEIIEDLNKYQVALIRAMRKDNKYRDQIFDYFHTYHREFPQRIERFMMLYRLSFSPKEI